jgi:two-component system, chemotaxis family, sensor kinase CheA
MELDPYRYFRVEARELLEQLGRGALDLEQSAPPELVSRLLRLAHTLKGAARVVRQPAIADLAHAIEDTLAPLREAGGAVARGPIDEILGHLDAIAERLAALALPARREGPAAEGMLRAVRADVAEMDALRDGLAAAHVELGALQGTLGAVERARQTAALAVAQLSSPRGHESAGAAGDRPAAARTQSMVQELSDRMAVAAWGLGTGLERLERELAEVRDAAERLRLLPAATLFTPLERAARDAAQTMGRRVTFAGTGGDVRLEAHVLATVQRALLQMIRNAVAHGIEAEGERQAAGKPAAGRITVEVVRHGGRVTFRCHDDGRGVDLAAVRRAAQGKGLLPETLHTLGPEDLLRVLLKGGLSTAGTVTEMSGRGVGLDVVREAAAALGGEVRAETWPGEGTLLELVVPVSVSSFQALVVEAAGTTVAIPLDAVQRTLRVSPEDRVAGAAGSSLVVAGRVIPFVALERACGRRSTAARPAGAWSAVVVGGAAAAALGVDRIVGVESVLLCPLPAHAGALPVVAGASLDVAGNPRLVLDPAALAAAAYRTASDAPAEPAARDPILVIDDSLTTRMLEQSILESAGYEVDLATSGEEALGKARHRRYGLFLVDVEMPGMDGFAFLEQAGTDPLLCEVPAILVTSRNAPEDRRRGEEVGARGYVVKSEFDQTDLLQRIGRLVRREHEGESFATRFAAPAGEAPR